MGHRHSHSRGLVPRRRTGSHRRSDPRRSFDDTRKPDGVLVVERKPGAGYRPSSEDRVAVVIHDNDRSRTRRGSPIRTMPLRSRIAEAFHRPLLFPRPSSSLDQQPRLLWRGRDQIGGVARSAGFGPGNRPGHTSGRHSTAGSGRGGDLAARTGRSDLPGLPTPDTARGHLKELRLPGQIPGTCPQQVASAGTPQPGLGSGSARSADNRSISSTNRQELVREGNLAVEGLFPRLCPTIRPTVDQVRPAG